MMTSANACIFLAFGFVMELLPTVAPQWFPATGWDGSSAQAIWLHLMGAVQALLGGVYLVNRLVVPEIERAATVVFPGAEAAQDGVGAPDATAA